MRIHNAEELGRLTVAQMKRGVYTNVLRPLEETVDAQPFEGGLLLFCQRPGYVQLKFFLQSGAALPEMEVAQPCVTELVYRAGDGRMEEIVAEFQRHGFRRLMNRVCLSCKTLPERPADPTPLPSIYLSQAMDLMGRSFHPYAGCLPTEEALLTDIQKGNVLCALEGESVTGLLHIGEGKIQEIRHLAVHPAYQGRGIGGGLIAAFLHRAGGRGRVWTAEDNVPALRAYEAFHFAPDGRRSVVLLRE